MSSDERSCSEERASISAVWIMKGLPNSRGPTINDLVHSGSLLHSCSAREQPPWRYQICHVGTTRVHPGNAEWHEAPVPTPHTCFVRASTDSESSSFSRLLFCSFKPFRKLDRSTTKQKDAVEDKESSESSVKSTYSANLRRRMMRRTVAHTQRHQFL